MFECNALEISTESTSAGIFDVTFACFPSEGHLALPEQARGERAETQRTTTTARCESPNK